MKSLLPRLRRLALLGIVAILGGCAIVPLYPPERHHYYEPGYYGHHHYRGYDERRW